MNFTIETFLAFARTKPTDEEYDFVSNRDCPIAQFLKANGVEDPIVSTSAYWVRWKNHYFTPEQYRISAAANGFGWKFALEHQGVRTWGALVARLEG